MRGVVAASAAGSVSGSAEASSGGAGSGPAAGTSRLPAGPRGRPGPRRRRRAGASAGHRDRRRDRDGHALRHRLGHAEARGARRRRRRVGRRRPGRWILPARHAGGASAAAVGAGLGLGLAGRTQGAGRREQLGPARLEDAHVGLEAALLDQLAQPAGGLAQLLVRQRERAVVDRHHQARAQVLERVQRVERAHVAGAERRRHEAADRQQRDVGREPRRRSRRSPRSRRRRRTGTRRGRRRGPRRTGRAPRPPSPWLIGVAAIWMPRISTSPPTASSTTRANPRSDSSAAPPGGTTTVAERGQLGQRRQVEVVAVAVGDEDQPDLSRSPGARPGSWARRTPPSQRPSIGIEHDVELGVADQGVAWPPNAIATWPGRGRGSGGGRAGRGGRHHRVSQCKAEAPMPGHRHAPVAACAARPRAPWGPHRASPRMSPPSGPRSRKPPGSEVASALRTGRPPLYGRGPP